MKAHRRMRPGWSLMDVVMAVALAGFISAAYVRLFMDCLQTGSQVERTQMSVSQLDSAMNRLRQDLRDCTAMQTPNPTTLIVTLPDSSTVRWQAHSTPQGTQLHRMTQNSDANGAAEVMHTALQDIGFEAQGSILLVHWRGYQQTLNLSMISHPLTLAKMVQP